ncbi:MAG: DMT family transporter [Clostridia bacterium]|nr:DMT family transporter [Clostridia bacterium]
MTPWFLLSLCSLLWGMSITLGKMLAATIPPVALGTLRWTAAVALLLPWILVEQRSDPRSLLVEFRQGMGAWLTMGLTGVGAYSALQYFGMRYTTSVNAALFNAAGPAFIAVLALIWLRERPGAWQVAGLLLSLLGVAVIITQGSWAVLAGLDFNFGDLVLVGNQLLWAVYSVVGRLASGRVGAVRVTAYSAVPGLVALWVWAGAAGELSGLHLNLASVPPILFIGMCGSGLGYILWNRGVADVGAGRAAVFLALVPVFTAVDSFFLLGEQMTWSHAVGGFLVVCGVFLTSRTASGSGHVSDPGSLAVRRA